ncbi:sensor histidine kinase [Novosphingobium sp.]|uniref:sensor histidine kinase n=1 Tax=Novosphingobium sp. TaxID=1874826 RepID=UPI003BACC708
MVRITAHLPLLALLLAVSTAQALPLNRNLLQLKHTRWTTDDGAPDNIRALAQSADGYLWIGSGGGLYRFDGITFQHVPTSSVEEAVTALVGTHRGDIWAGLQNGHVLLLHLGRQFDRTPVFGNKRVRQLAEDRSGGIWMLAAGTDVQLAHYVNGTWRPFGIRNGIPANASIKAMRAARDGALWIVADTGVQVLREGESQFRTVSPGSPGLSDIVEDGEGRIWSVDHLKGLRALFTPPEVAANPARDMAFTDQKNELRWLTFDSDGGLWGLAHSSGVFRIRPPAYSATGARAFEAEAFTQNEGLSSNFARAILEDREHNIWVGTSLGLDRFRTASVVRETAIPQYSPYGYIVISDHRGVVYVADSDTLYRVSPGGAPVAVLRQIDNPQTLCEDAEGNIWLAATNGLFRIHDGIAAIVRNPLVNAHYYKQCAADREHGVWFLTGDGDFSRYDGTKWTKIPFNPAGENSNVSLFDFDAQGRLLAFYENTGLLQIDGGRSVNLWPAKQIPGERVGALQTGPDDVLVGTVSGLARVRGNRVDQLGPYAWTHHVTGIARTREGATWLQSSQGIFRVSTSRLEAAFDHPGQTIDGEWFDAQDGLTGANQLEYAANGAAVGGDGRIWFATVTGIVWIDPAAYARNRAVPPIDVQRVIADGHSFDSPVSIELTPGTRNLEIDYTALSLTIPERVRFKYQLVGADEYWIDPGSRRSAFYQNLAPGDYVFKVIAANNDGVWNTVGATVRLRLPPTFLQSSAFKVICAAAVLLLFWTIYRLRLNRITTRLREQMETRLIERERIARELHDTLLQGVHGLILRFQGIADRLPREQVPGRLMEKALERAEDLLVEGRERVHGLRSVPLANDLRSSLAAAVAHAELPASTTVGVREIGTVSAIDGAVHEELVWILREALSNVAQHAGATVVDIAITYRWNRLIVTLTDNGKGIGSDKPVADTRRHFGMIGMRERARRISARLKIGPGPDKTGTQVTVTVPARTAYSSGLFRRASVLLGFSSSEPTL